MEFVNETKVAAGWTVCFGRDGRETIVVAIKATFAIPRPGEEPELVDEQVPLIEADVFSGEPGLSATLYETDFAHHKPFCDVLLNGSAYAPDGQPAKQVPVAIRVGDLVKQFNVVGDRVWRLGLAGCTPGAPQPFVVMPVSYNNAFGGTDVQPSGAVETYLDNPVGRGFASGTKEAVGKPVCNTEEVGKTVAGPRGSYRPMALGAIGRHWKTRACYVGTYDERWLAEESPIWPKDFDERYFQAAPADQQIPHVTESIQVSLRNLTPDGFAQFQIKLPPMPVLAIDRRNSDRKVSTAVDTIVIEPDLGRYSLTWRGILPLRRHMFELRELIAGQMPEAWYRSRRFGGKPYYRGLAELVNARKGIR
jgi:hypothetical protein